MSVLLCTLACLAGLSGCGPSYRKLGLIGGGYEDLKLETNTYRVSYYGVSQEKWTISALYRCAERTLEQGYDDFEIIDRIDIAGTSPRTTNEVSTRRSDASGASVQAPRPRARQR